MGFLERLRSYLERVERTPEGLPWVRIDMAAHRQHFAVDCDRANERREARLEQLLGRGEETTAWTRLAHEERQQQRQLGESLTKFVEDVADRILEALAPGASAEELTRLINVAISSQCDGQATTGSPGLDEEILRLANQARERTRSLYPRDGWESPAQYAFEVQATRRKNDRSWITRHGVVFLELSGIDAVRWLLALESAQSLGPTDPWRLSFDLAAELLQEPSRTIDGDEFVAGAWRSLSTIRRLGAMGLLDYQHQDLRRGEKGWSYAVFERARPLLEEIAERRPTPFAVLASALLRDETTRRLDLHSGQEGALRESAAAAFDQQARLVVHEIRNALIPSQIALSRLVREMGDLVETESIQRHHGRVEAGIRRALTFADDMVRIAKLGAEPVTPFDVAAAVRDAMAGVSTELNGSLRYHGPASGQSPVAVGTRARFTLAVTELLRNAARAIAEGKGIVEVSLEVAPERIFLRVDDSGTGVPPELWRMIFEAGVTLRPGGSGQGLSLVRQVIEGEMSGTVSCGESPLGGARFEIILPVRETRDS